jgi:hypothetical protein
MTTEQRMMVDELRRQRWWLWPLIAVSAVVAWWFFPVWVLTIIALVLAVRSEWVIHQGRRVVR